MDAKASAERDRADTAATTAKALESATLSLVELSQSAPQSSQDAIASARATLVEAANLTGVKLKPTAVGARVYVQVSDESQLDAVRNLIQQMRQMKLGDQPLSVIAPVKPGKVNSTSLRCFRREECAAAKPLLDAINARLVSPKLVLQDFSKQYQNSTAIRAQHYELYFSPGQVRLAL